MDSSDSGILGFASDPASTMPGYMLGGISSFGFSIGTTVGLAAIGLDKTPIFPTYPNVMTQTEINSGYVFQYTAMALAGKGGAFGLLLAIFMCVTSTSSKERSVVVQRKIHCSCIRGMN
ncbi:hypothetical protein V1506DRAFT_524953 [Lipomyces tetrasporus]